MSKILGNKVIKIIDVGVAGIHRLFSRLDVIRGAKVRNKILTLAFFYRNMR